MNYRHAFHAGNFADVVKHATLALVIERLKQKETPFRVIDTHAGAGLYELGEGSDAERTGEWRDGIGRLIGAGAEPIPEPQAALLEPYLGAVRAFNGDGGLTRYPGSPRLARALLRPQDALVANELHPQDAATLRRQLGRDPQTRVLELDGYTALRSTLPPRERRGVILIDPPFEEPGELERMAEGLTAARRRFATGIYILWHPIKDAGRAASFRRALAASDHKKLLAATCFARAPADVDMLNGCGLIIANPPWQLDQALSTLLPWLAKRLALGPGARGSAEWLAG